MNKGLFIIVCFIYCSCLPGQIVEDIFIERTVPAITELRDFVSIPNDAIYPADIQKNINWLQNAFEQRAFKTQTLTTGGNPVFFAEKRVSGDLPTVLFYMHLDGQAIDPSKWDQKDPYEIVLKKKGPDGNWKAIDWSSLDAGPNPEWRLFGRSAADDKGPIVAFLHAIDLLSRQGKNPVFNIKVILDSEEEKGSKNLPAAVKKYHSILSADVLIINDGPVHISSKPTLIFGCRGIMRLDLTVFGPSRPQHSGHFGNYIPNPAFRLAHLLASIKNEDGKVLIDGYYDGIVLNTKTRKILEQVPDNRSEILAAVQIAEPELVGNNYQESLQYPSFNVRGMASAWIGDQARTIIPDKATAAIDIRLVPESDPNRLITLIKRHVEDQGYSLVEKEPTVEERAKYKKIALIEYGSITRPFRTDLQSWPGAWLSNALRSMYQSEPVKIRIMGGTVPIAPFIRELNVPAIIVPMVNADNNQHSPNENLRIDNLTNAMRSFYAILTTPMNIH
jgi:acetylornithine deacetylase/succinyl-diaminopimelate desuccinylase-like protein